MTNKEGAKVADMTRALSVVLAYDLNASNEQVRFTPRTRNLVDRARIQGLELLRSRVQNAEAAIEQADAWVTTAEQEEFDFSPPPNEKRAPDQVTERPEIERTFGEDEQGLFPEDQPEGSGDVNAGIPMNIRRGLAEALNDGAGPKKACQLVAKASGLDFADVRDHFEQLERNGAIEKQPVADAAGNTNGKTHYVWVADMPAEIPAETEGGVVATSETPEGAGVGF